MADYKFLASLLIAGSFVLVGFWALGYALIVTGQLLLGVFGFAACLAVAAVLVWISR